VEFRHHVRKLLDGNGPELKSLSEMSVALNVHSLGFDNLTVIAQILFQGRIEKVPWVLARLGGAKERKFGFKLQRDLSLRLCHSNLNS
jgi:hypothetical protein